MVVKELQLVPSAPSRGSSSRNSKRPSPRCWASRPTSARRCWRSRPSRFNKDRNQYHTTAIMRRLLTLKDMGTPLIIGVADVDLFVPDSPFVYGEADRESHAAVMSLWRLKGEGEAWKRRTFVEAVHQAGTSSGSRTVRTRAARCTWPPPSPTRSAASSTSATTAGTSWRRFAASEAVGVVNKAMLQCVSCACSDFWPFRYSLSCSRAAVSSGAAVVEAAPAAAAAPSPSTRASPSCARTTATSTWWTRATCRPPPR